MPYRTIQEIKDANKRAGGHWFGEEEMAFFASRIESEVIKGRYFITSEQYLATDYGKTQGFTDGPRKYSVRVCDDNGHIETVGEHMAYDTLKQAKEAVERLP